MFLLNSRLGHFTATPSDSPPRGWIILLGHHFSRSYVAILPSSLTRVISRTLVFSTRLPVSDCGTGAALLARRFSRQYGFNHFVPVGTRTHASALPRRICLSGLPTRLNRHFQSPDDLASCVPPSLITLTAVQEYQPVVHHLRLSTSA